MVIPIGGSVRFIPLEDLASAFRCSVEGLKKTLDGIQLPYGKIGGTDTEYTNLCALEIALFRGSLPKYMRNLDEDQAAFLQAILSIEWGTLDATGLKKRLISWAKALTSQQVTGKFTLSDKDRRRDAQAADNRKRKSKTPGRGGKGVKCPPPT